MTPRAFGLRECDGVHRELFHSPSMYPPARYLTPAPRGALPDR